MLPKPGFLAIFYWKTLPKPWRVPKKPKFWCQNAGGYPKKKFWSLELPSYPMLQNLFFFFFFFLFFGHPSGFWEHFGAKPCQNHGGYQKSQSFGAKTREGTKKTKKSNVLESSAAKLPKTLFFVFFWTSSGFWEHFGAKPCQNHGGYQNQPKFWSLELPSYPMLQSFALFFGGGTLQRFGTKTLVFLRPSMVLAGFCSKMLPKH